LRTMFGTLTKRPCVSGVKLRAVNLTRIIKD
jgi:hypothetical protein